jgi:peptidyl-prolyl cis-trans isomerase D
VLQDVLDVHLAQRVRDELPPELVKSEQKKLLDEFIAREVMVQRAQSSGYRISDAELAATLRQIPALQVDGQFSRDRYAALLRQQGRTEAEFEREFRKDLETNQLRNAMQMGLSSGHKTMEMSLIELVSSGMITQDTAVATAFVPHEVDPTIAVTTQH